MYNQGKNSLNISRRKGKWKDDRSRFFELIQTKQIKLTDKQKKAVTTSEGVVLVISVPGSGKTLSSIIRIGYLILVRNINPNLISCISFSKAAALEMKIDLIQSLVIQLNIVLIFQLFTHYVI